MLGDNLRLLADGVRSLFDPPALKTFFLPRLRRPMVAASEDGDAAELRYLKASEARIAAFLRTGTTLEQVINEQVMFPQGEGNIFRVAFLLFMLERLNFLVRVASE